MTEECKNECGEGCNCDPKKPARNEQLDKHIKELKQLKKALKDIKEQRMPKEGYVVIAIYWLLAALLVILKAIGLSTLSWFWTTIMVFWPFYMAIGFVAIAGASVVILIIVAIIAATIEYFMGDGKQKKDDTKKP